LENVVEGVEFLFNTKFIVFPSYEADVDRLIPRSSSVWESSPSSLFKVSIRLKWSILFGNQNAYVIYIFRESGEIVVMETRSRRIMGGENIRLPF
jgi:hypothetical protein